MYNVLYTEGKKKRRVT